MNPAENHGPTPPRNPDEALETVLRTYGRPTRPDGTPLPLRVREFSVGYLVYATAPPLPPADGIPQPAAPGGSCFIVAKDTGQTTPVPNYPPDQAIDVYLRHVQRLAPDAAQRPADS